MVLSVGSYSLLEKTVWRSLPYGDASRLVLLGKGNPLQESDFQYLSLPDIEVVRSRATCFEAVAYEVNEGGTIGPRSERPRIVTVARISSNWLDVLRVQPAIGRPFRPDDFEPGAPDAALVSFAVWQEVFSKDPKALGSELEINGERVTVIGVMPETMRRPAVAASIWMPFKTSVDDLTAYNPDKRAIARLRKGVSWADARQELREIQPAPTRVSRRPDQDRFKAVSLSNLLVGKAERALSLLLGVCLLVHVMACFNVGHLQRARRLNLCRNLGIQLALGCSTRGLCLEAFAEAAVLASVAATLAIAVLPAFLSTAMIVAASAFGLPVQAALSGNVLLLAVVLAVTSASLCGVFPVLLLRRVEVTSLLSQRWGGAGTFAASKLQDALIVGQVGIAVLLMTGFGLMAKSVYRLSTVSLGFETERLSYVVADAGGLMPPAVGLKIDEVLANLMHMPGVESVSVGSTPILAAPGLPLRIAVGTEGGEWTETQPINFQAVSGSYFSTLGIPLLAGRTFDESDTYGRPCSAIVNRSFALRFWPGPDPLKSALGSRIDLSRRGTASSLCTIIGVVEDARTTILASPLVPEFYLSHHQKQALANIIVFVKARPGMKVPPSLVDDAMQKADPRWRADFSTDVEALASAAIVPSRRRAELLGALGLVGLLFAAVGMYATAGHALSRREQEIGVRLALGARLADVALVLCRRYVVLAFGGACIGMAFGLVTGRFAAAGLSLFETRALDPGIFFLAPVISSLVVLASMIPVVVRAARINPSDLLRRDAF
jgi:putative ABC transport system permease protein